MVGRETSTNSAQSLQSVNRLLLLMLVCSDICPPTATIGQTNDQTIDQTSDQTIGQTSDQTTESDSTNKKYVIVGVVIGVGVPIIIVVIVLVILECSGK
jgi:hypothetical protein